MCIECKRMYGKHKHHIMVMVITSTRSSGVRCMACIKNNNASWVAQMEISKFSHFAPYVVL